MAAKFAVLFVACFALSGAAHVRRDAPAQNNVLQELEKSASDFGKTLSDQWQALMSSQNTQEFNKAIKDGSDSVLSQLSTFSNSLQGVINDANGKTKEALEQTRSNLERTAEELRRAHPEVEQQATQLRDKLQHALQNVVQESQKLAKEVGTNMDETNKKLAPQIKSAYDAFVKQAEEVQKKLHEAATKQ